ncbi:MAG: alpha/beta fold hydrolase, partial [Candidatus Cloacimonadaceae bacterium]|nr:alpha/beta fold hydrolase [Candidatus Cloacimonadaceae bacterium]
MYYRVIFATLILTILSATSLSAKEPQSFAGSWSGAISIMGMELPILVDFEQAQELRAFMSIPAQGLNSQELKIIRHEGDEIVFVLNVPGANATFSGTRTGGKMSGSFEQAGALGSFELVYQGVYVPKIEKPFILPPGVSEEEMILKTEAGAIFGTMMLPERKEGFTVALIIAGSGPTDRDGNSPLLPGKNNSLQMLGNALVKKGNMVLRIDKRGIGKSVWPGLREEDMTIDMMAEDASAWLTFLRAQPGIHKVAVIGHSEGSLVALLAARTADPQTLVLLTPLAADFFDTVFKQLAGAPAEY